MRIRYENTIEDLLAFSLHFHQKSPTLRKHRLWVVICLAIMILGMTFAASEVTGDPIVFWTGVIGAAVIVVIYPRLYRRNVKRLSSRLYAEGQNRALLGPHVTELRDNGLFVATDFREGVVFWKGIERIESIPGHTFVYLSAMSALVISEHSVFEGSYQGFIEELQRRWRLAHGA
ncbi:MAG: hypothetical protein FD138_3043 [Planctomycetota bacterium]|nr:MAG: hypothetical protein FD138_3043 [Planctomycetota bacterium]